jgi:large subunit ribosomal protein L24
MNRLKKNDKVLILKGKDRSKTGQILHVLPKKNQVVVEGLNLVTRHVRPRRQGEKGQRVQVPAPIDSSNIKLICPKCKKPTRVSFQQDAKKKKVRICKNCKAIID